MFMSQSQNTLPEFAQDCFLLHTIKTNGIIKKMIYRISEIVVDIYVISEFLKKTIF